MNNDLTHRILYCIFGAGMVALAVLGLVYPDRMADAKALIGILAGAAGLAAKSPLTND